MLDDKNTDHKVNYSDLRTWRAKIRNKNHEEQKIASIPKPFLKWAGGKRQLLKVLAQNLPKEYNTYYEPFVGGGALFFYLLPDNAMLFDNNPILMNVYQVIQRSVDELIQLLQEHRNEKEYFYSIRKMDRNGQFQTLSPIEKASRTIFLNKTCFNGLYRVNSRGEFNVPFGRYKNPNYCDIPNLEAVHKALQNISLQVGSFEKVLDFAEKGDFVYFDPPYVPLSKTANFTSYTKEDFAMEDQQRLVEVFNELDQRGCKVLLSNSYSDFVLDKFQQYEIIPVDAKRAINSDASKRGYIKEALIRNYSLDE